MDSKYIPPRAWADIGAVIVGFDRHFNYYKPRAPLMLKGGFAPISNFAAHH